MTLERDMREWGMDALARIDKTLGMPALGLYAEEFLPAQPSPLGKLAVMSSQPAFMWGCGVQLSALIAAAALDPAGCLPLAQRYAEALSVYWIEHNGLGGYDVQPRPNPSDRYYDDNVWIVLALADLADLTQDGQWRERAVQTMQFVLSGEDETLDGGLYWRENERRSKNTCSNAPAIAAALRLYQGTSDPAHLATAQRLYAWTNAHLQDTDGLFFDAIGIDGSVHKKKWSYNSALMIRANTLFYEITHEPSLLAEAQRIARAAQSYWVRPETGALADEATFAHLLSESLLYLCDQDHDAGRFAAVRGALDFLHAHARSAQGDYGSRWDAPPDPAKAVSLLSQASAARGFLAAAPYFA